MHRYLMALIEIPCYKLDSYNNLKEILPTEIKMENNVVKPLLTIIEL